MANKRCTLDAATEVVEVVVRVCAILIWLVTCSNGPGNVCRIVIMALVRCGWLVEEVEDIKEQLARELRDCRGCHGLKSDASTLMSDGSTAERR